MFNGKRVIEDPIVPEFIREDNLNDLGGINALEHPIEDYMSQPNSDRGIVVPQKTSRLGRLARRGAQDQEYSGERDFITTPQGHHKLIRAQHHNAPYDAD